MEAVNRLLDTTVGELEKILTTRTVVGDPIEVDGHTIIPLVSVGFGFGGGGGGDPRRTSITHLPRSTGEVRPAWEVRVRMLPWPSSPRRGLSAPYSTRRKCGPLMPSMP